MVKLSQANEDYIEAIWMLAQGGNGPVRSVDLAKKLEVSKPSVNKAIALLKQQGLVTQQPYGDIFLTQEGVAYGQAMLRRHETLTCFFHEVLGVEQPRAEEEACCVEHAISQDTFERWAAFLERTLQR